MTDQHDPLLDPPSWAPTWLPTVDDERRFRTWRWIVGVVLAAGLAGCIAEGADQPADPVVADAPEEPSAPGAEATEETDREGPSLAERFGTVAARLVDVGGEILELCLLHADTDQERAQGLMQVTDLEGHDGMLFSVDQPSDGAFYMYRTLMPLTIGWFGADGAFVSRADMAPCASDESADCERYPPAGAWASAIEVVQGDPLAERFRPGTTLTVTGRGCPA